MDQLTLFHDDEVPMVRPKPPTAARAGTHLDHRWTQKIYVGNQLHGLLDASQRIYQGGGSVDKFIYWKERLVTIDARVWVQIKDKTDFIEMVDHNGNQAWRIATGKAKKHLQTYSAGIGRRIGIPMDCWDVYDAHGSQINGRSR
jgi:hypothetical protein